eukprot:1002238-Amphidinium_carterae.1
MEAFRAPLPMLLLCSKTHGPTVNKHPRSAHLQETKQFNFLRPVAGGSLIHGERSSNAPPGRGKQHLCSPLPHGHCGLTCTPCTQLSLAWLRRSQ